MSSESAYWEMVLEENLFLTMTTDIIAGAVWKCGFSTGEISHIMQEGKHDIIGLIAHV